MANPKVEVHVTENPLPPPEVTQEDRDRSVKYGRRGGAIKGAASRYDAWTELENKAGARGFLGIREVFQHPAPGPGEETTWVGKRGILPTAILAENGAAGLGVELDERWQPGVWSIVRLSRNNWNSLTKQENGEPYPEVSYSTSGGVMKKRMPPEDDDGTQPFEPPDPQSEELAELQHDEAVLRQRRKLSALREELGLGGGEKPHRDGVLESILPVLLQKVLERPPEAKAFDVAAMEAIFRAQQEASRAMVGNVVAVQQEMTKAQTAAMLANAEAQANMSRRMMRETLSFMTDLMRHQMQVPAAADTEDLPVWGRMAIRGLSALEKAFDRGAVRGAAPARPAAGALPAGTPEAQRAHRIRTLFRLLALEAHNRPDPETFVDEHLAHRIGMMAEEDRNQVLGFVRTFASGDFTAVTHLLGWFTAHQTPGIQEFSTFLGTNALAQTWVAHVLGALAAYYEPEEAAPEAPGGPPMAPAGPDEGDEPEEAPTGPGGPDEGD